MTEKYAVVGNPIAQSLSPVIHSAFATETGEDIHYGRHLVEPEGFAAFASAFFAGGGAGLNVTAPFKLDACDFADELTPGARAAGAVNTLLRRADGKIIGETTDGPGLVADIQRLGWPIAGRRVLLLGAGGAARGVLLPLLEQGPALVHIANRTGAKAADLAVAFAEQGLVTGAGLDSLEEPFDLVINASSAGLSGEMPDLPDVIIHSGSHAYDMVYGAEPTPFMRWAAERGADTADGLGMLVGQAAESFHLWRGVRPAVEPVLALLREELRQKLAADT